MARSARTRPVLRVETVINKPDEFEIRRRVRQQGSWVGRPAASIRRPPRQRWCAAPARREPTGRAHADRCATGGKCARCLALFTHAGLGDFAYGEAIFSTEDGRHYVHASGFTEFAKNVARLIPGNGHTIWPFLAALADPVSATGLTHGIVCPNCRSTELAYWGGARGGTTSIPEATFLHSEQLDTRMLAQRIAEIM